MKERARRILVTMPTINMPERLKLDGILAYAHEKPGVRWQIVLDFGALSGAPAPIRSQRADGVIAYVDSDTRRREIVAAGVPAVLIEDALAPKRFPRARHVATLLCDHAAEGRAAADYFLERHFTSFAWLGPESPTDWSRERRRGFAERLGEAGFSCTDVQCAEEDLPSGLAALPRPSALFASHDFRARQALDAAAAADIPVPRDLAVLGVDDDAAICTTVSPALSSLPTDDIRLGYTAGRLLNGLIREPMAGGRTIRFAAHRVVARLSTDADALSDRFVAEALRHARGHLADRLDAATLARRVGYSRHMLQIRAERALGHSLGEEIRRMRLAAAKDLISDTDMPIADIAESCGFTSLSHLALRFRERFGLTPLAWRHRST
ncbi:MAG: substrate-binding domain-containing protein [Kiritimatiellae bacterium]|nr:substrate-binding domain-containing protein [Kiritimatiellia bacterium]